MKGQSGKNPHLFYDCLITLFRFGKIHVHRLKKEPDGLKEGEDPSTRPSQDASGTTEMEQETGDEEPDVAALSLVSELREEEEKLMNGKGENVLLQPSRTL